MQRLTIKGQVTIPKKIRDLLGLRAGRSAVDFVVTKDGSVLIRRSSEPDQGACDQQLDPRTRYRCDHVLGLLRGQCV